MKLLLATSATVIGFGFLGCTEILSNPTTDMAADTVFTNGKMYTVDKSSPWVEAIAVKDGEIRARGSSAEINAYVGENTEVVDLNGRMAMPGINDAHSHMYGGLVAKYQCLFSAELGPEEIKSVLQGCVDKAKPGEFVLGGYWVSSFFDDNDIPSPKGWLDEISASVPILLADDSGHNSWANSAALAKAGFNKDTPPIKSGTIVRDADGQPNGLLYEAASAQIESYFDDQWTHDQREAGVRFTLAAMSGYGITGLKDAKAKEGLIAMLHSIDQNEGLPAYIGAAQYTELRTDDRPLDYDQHSRIREQYAAKNLSASFIKFYLDGVPTSSRSAAMMIDYSPDPNYPDADLTNGMLHISQSVIERDVAELDDRGFIIKIHAAGDRSLHVALNAIEYAREKNGNVDKMHDIAHAGFITENDLPRFVSLNVSPDISPYLWFPSAIMDNINMVLPERGSRYWPNRTLYDLGAVITAGSDWPSVSPTLSPWYGIEATVTRQHPEGIMKGEYWPEERLTLEETLEIFTINGAKALLIDQEAGTLSVGKNANIIVLNQNLFDIPVNDISETKVEQTWYRGRRVH